MQGIVNVLTGYTNTAKRGQLITASLGLAIFFDDYANCMIIGNTMRPLTDRMKISREKLSYIVDSTAAPVATLSVISTWVVAKMGFIVETGVIRETEMFTVFLELLPYSFYSLFTLFFVFLIAASRRDFGPMRKAENRALDTGQVIRPGATPLADTGMTDFDAEGDMSRRWYVAALPVFGLIGFTILGLVGGTLLDATELRGPLPLQPLDGVVIVGAGPSGLAAACLGVRYP